MLEKGGTSDFLACSERSEAKRLEGFGHTNLFGVNDGHDDDHGD
jgi:hypothetical protein